MFAIHALQTGTVQVKTRQRRGKGRGPLRIVNTLLDREWTGSLPIHAWLIEHPDGLILVDTGETARATEPGYFPRWHPYYRLAVRLDVTRDQEIDRELERLGFAAADVRHVVLTHLHTDHAGGIGHFPHAEIHVSQPELDAAAGFRGRVGGYMNQHFPDWLSPRPIAFTPEPVGPFPESSALADGVRVIPTPGHTPGHVAVLVDGAGEGPDVLLAGDATYTEEILLDQAIDGVAPDPDQARDTLTRLLALARERPLVYLPAHDPESAQRLTRKTVVPRHES